ncbi:hypothetical protein GCM10010112_94030 [Actinoplanes lobatus]|uniref:Uncharacterized protein n=1 Tax=Actinoplanes lobatus TaxID=113568 RepID=A0A7W7HEN8_9ACTN|nr:hypothetical protein [Actinoplanes lobatus]MBB4749166.1 hypothetical protein [Actinoplanes lobatus]GGN99868.1 hypothetical protein GCM10010112_94030 [Actinoplanes lobatus]GIE46443.1 hypothetical protein Alo02nite_93410 [Actinoplanes lobatus]
MASDDAADRLAQVAAQLAARVREYGAEANGTWLRHQLPDPADRWRLIFVLAAAVPIDRPWLDLTAWTRGDT